MSPWLLFSLFWFVPAAAYAYIGPGAGISAIGSLLTLSAAVLLAILGFIWYPVKRLLKKRNKNPAQAAEENDREETP